MRFVKKLTHTLAALRASIHSKSRAWVNIVCIGGLFLLFFPAVHVAVTSHTPAAYPVKFCAIHAVVYAFVAVCTMVGRWLGEVEWRSGEGTPSKNFDRKVKQRVEAGQVLLISSWAMLICFIVVSLAFVHAPYSPMWRTNCSEFDTADALRLDRADSSLHAASVPRGGHKVHHVGARSLRGGVADLNAGSEEGTVCIAVATAPRQGRYLTQGVASLLQGKLSDEASAFLAGPILLVTSHDHAEAETLAKKHQPAVELRRIHLPNDTTNGAAVSNSSNKILRETQDYIAALEACVATNASYALVLEDDAISGPDLVHSVVGALRSLETQRAGQWISLRLWAHDKFEGWGWDRHLLSELLPSAIFGGLVCALILWLALRLHSRLVILLAGSVSALGIAILCEAAGRQYVFNPFSPGLSLDFAPGATGKVGHYKGYAGIASSVAMVFPLDARLPPLLGYLRSHANETQIDHLTRLYLRTTWDQSRGAGVESMGLEQWMIWPPLVQHIGRVSSVGHTSADWKCRAFPLATAFRGNKGGVLA